MTNSTPPNIAALLEAADKATPGPWCEHPNGSSVWTGTEYDSTGTREQTNLVGTHRLTSQGYYDIAFIAAARNAVPDIRALVDERDALATRVKEMEKALKDIEHNAEKHSGWWARTTAAQALARSKGAEGK